MTSRDEHRSLTNRFQTAPVVFSETHETRSQLTRMERAAATVSDIRESEICLLKEQVSELQNLLDVTLSSKQHEDAEIQRLLEINSQLESQVQVLNGRVMDTVSIPDHQQEVNQLQVGLSHLDSEHKSGLETISKLKAENDRQVLELKHELESAKMMLIQHNDCSETIKLLKEEISELQARISQSIPHDVHQEIIVQFEKTMQGAFELQKNKINEEFLAKTAEYEENATIMKSEMNRLQSLLEGVLLKKQQLDVECERMAKENIQMQENMSEMISKEQYLKATVKRK